jgi:hypothetical protein
MRNLPIPDGVPPGLRRLLQTMVGDRRINTGPVQPLAITAGSTTIPTNYSFFSIDAPGASTDLNSILGGLPGDLIFLQSVSSLRAIVLKHGIGNILCNGSADLTIASVNTIVMLHYNGTNWRAILWTAG